MCFHMADDETPTDGRVTVSMELTGEYDDIVSKLDSTATEDATLSPVTDDLSVLLDTVVQLGGGTRSAIAQELPTGMTASYDAQAVVEALQVLERYDLVVLEGNTWKPGPNLQE